MIPRTRETIVVRSHDTDGTLLGERTVTQNVYRPEGEQPYIMWAGGKRPLVSDSPPVAHYDVLAHVPLRSIDKAYNDAVEYAEMCKRVMGPVLGTWVLGEGGVGFLTTVLADNADEEER